MEGTEYEPKDENLDLNIETAGTNLTIYFDRSGTNVETGTELVYYLNWGRPARCASIRCNNNVIITERNGVAYLNPINVPKPYINTTTNDVSLGGFNRKNLNWSFVKIRIETVSTQLRIYAQG